MSRAGRAAGRPHASAASPGYRSGDVDDIEGLESLDLMDDTPAGPLSGPPSSTATTTSHKTHIGSAQELLSRLERKYHLPPSGAQSSSRDGTTDNTSAAAAGEQRHAGRRVMSTPRRPHTTPVTVVRVDAHDDPIHSAGPINTMPVLTAQAGHSTDIMVDARDGLTATSTEQLERSGAAEDEAGVDASPTAAKSTDAYRFLLNHIDAEIAALQRRHSSVTTRRQGVQTRQTQRIKELFDLIEAPWTLLITEMQPALPATGVDVYIKEQQLARQQRHGSSSSGSSPAAGQEGQDKMYVLALHKNYKSMPAGRKRFYEEAANYNAAVRQELKYQLTRGCTRFEAFLDQVQECTMEMAREGQVPELPGGRAHPRFHLSRSPGSRHDGPHRTSSAAGIVGDAVRGRRHGVKAGHDDGDDDGDTPRAAEGAGSEAVFHESSSGNKAVTTRGRRASRRIKGAAKTSAKGKTESPADAHTGADGSASLVAKRGTRSRRTSTKVTKTTKTSREKGSRSKKIPAGRAAAASSAGGPGVSRSIPLPNLNQLAVKKIKQIAMSHGKKKVASSKAGKAKPANSKKKKK